MRYLLPCQCGRKHPVEVGQAGQELACECGARLDVPTMRGIRSLQSVVERPTKPRWERKQGILFILGVAWVALGVSATVWWGLPAWRHHKETWEDRAEQLASRTEQLSSAESMVLWRMYRDHASEMLNSAARYRDKQVEQARLKRLSITAAVATVVGAVVIGLLFYRARRGTVGQPAAR